MNLTGGVKGLKNKMNQENTTVTSCKKRIGMRFFTHLVAFCFLFQTMLPAYAAALSSGQIQQVLDSIAEIEFSTTSGSYQYTAAPYIDTSAQDGYSNIQDFYGRLRDEYIESLGSPTYVPIGVGGITTILPIYDNPKLVGDSFVQSRYVRDQIQELLGRHLIDSDSAYFKDETSQLKTLYDNAFLYAKLASTTEIYGDPISESKFDRENSPYDMVWPERRVIHGETVIVPVVYLTEQTIAERRVTDHSVGFNSNVSFSRINIQDVDIKLGREAFLNVAGDFVVQNSSVSGCELDIVVGGSLRLLSSQVDACGNLTIAANSIEASTLVHRYDFGNETGGFFGEVTSISASGDLLVRSSTNIILQGVTVSAGDQLTFAANGNIFIGAQNITSSFEGGQGGWYVRRSGVSYLQSKLTAEETIQLIAGGQIVLDAAEIVSDRGHIELLAGLGITIEDELETVQSFKKGKFGKRKIEESIYQTIAIRSLLDAGKNIRLHSDFGDITLRAADIKGGLGTEVKAAGGKVNLLMTTETDHYTYSSVKKGLFTVTTKNKGHIKETGVPNTIVGGFAVEALGGVSVEYEGNPELSLDEQIAELSKFEGMEWMADVRASSPEVDWTAIELQYETWKESNTSITPAFAAVIAIAVACVAGPAIGSFVGEFGGVAVSAAIKAGMTSFVSQATLAAANGLVNGDVGGAMEDLASSDTLKSLAVAMVTAGAIAQIDAAIFDIDTESVNEAATAAKDLAEAGNATQAQIQAAVDAAIKEASTLSLEAQLVQTVTHASVNAGIETVITGQNFEESFMLSLGQSAVNSIGKHMANEIKANWDGPNATDLDTTIKYIAHAGAGCIIGAAKSSLSSNSSQEGCQSGALGGVVGELVSDVHKSQSQIADDVANLERFLKDNGLTDPSMLTPDQLEQFSKLDVSATVSELLELRRDGINLAKLGGALAAFISGADASQVNIAALTAENAAANNSLYLLPLASEMLNVVELVSNNESLYQLYLAWISGDEYTFQLALMVWGGEDQENPTFWDRINIFSRYNLKKEYVRRMSVCPSTSLTQTCDGRTITPEMAETFSELVGGTLGAVTPGEAVVLSGEALLAKLALQKSKPRWKGSSDNVELPNGSAIEETVTVRRVQGGTDPDLNKQSKFLIAVDDTNNAIIKKNERLNVSIGDDLHADYFLSKRPGAEIVEFQIPKWMDDFIEESALPQLNASSNPLYDKLIIPLRNDPTTPGRSFEFPPIWASWLEEVAIPGSAKIVKEHD
ncbi:DUF637 domain-containing protein [Microbulbifer sp. JMSA004]|uniref:DUF637 domain-containing protein n=1 Tax=Microbulbifer sp. JMSA004 TaxID=3243370 RepID=UPI0040392BFC